MKIQVLHDSAGTIYSIFAPVKGSRKGSIESPDPDRTVTEVDAPDISLSTDSESNKDVAAALASLIQDNRIVSGRLIARSEESSAG
jgi:hypothetical protein